MKEYIEKDRAVSVSYMYCHTVDGQCCGPDDVVELYEELKDIPAADVVEVRHGRWEKVRVNPAAIEFCCSECGHQSVLGWDNYCSNCGARMDGGGQ